jgi:hypothetical protein
VLYDLGLRDDPHHFGFGDPLVGFALYSVGSLVVQTFVVAFEDAAVPEVHEGLGARTHLLVVDHLELRLELNFELLEKFSRNDKQSLLVIVLWLFVLQHERHVSILRLRPQIREYFKRSRPNIFVNVLEYLLEQFVVL